MTIEEAQQLVEVWNEKHSTERCTNGNKGEESELQTTVALGHQFWELLTKANQQQVDLTIALTETLAQLNASCKR